LLEGSKTKKEYLGCKIAKKFCICCNKSQQIRMRAPGKIHKESLGRSFLGSLGSLLLSRVLTVDKSQPWLADGYQKDQNLEVSSSPQNQSASPDRRVLYAINDWCHQIPADLDSVESLKVTTSCSTAPALSHRCWCVPSKFFIVFCAYFCF